MPSDTPDWLPDTSASVDQLLPLTTYTIAHSPSNFFTFGAPLNKSYQSFYLNFFLPSNPGAYNISVSALDPLGNTYWTDSYSWSFSGSSYFAVDVPGTVGGSVLFRVQGNPLGATVEAALYASVAPLPGGFSKWRRDGRMKPIGSLAATAYVAVAGTLIAAPGAGTRLLIKKLSISLLTGAANACQAYWGATTGGTAWNPFMVSCSASQGNDKVEYYEDGILLDDNTSLAYAFQIGAPAAASFNAVYDVVK